MAERKWTAAQTEAIESREPNLVVSAAAGSGKTATLTERIIRLICGDEPRADISRMLIVTFTKAAAAELRERICAALSDAASRFPNDTYVKEQLSLVGSAEISTIDSLCLSLVRPMFDRAGLPADFRVGDDAELSAMRSEAMEEAVSFFYDTEDGETTDGFFALADALGSSRDEDLLDEALLGFESTIEQYGIGSDELRLSADELEAACGEDFLETKYGEVVLKLIADAAEHFACVSADLSRRMSEEECMRKSYVPAALEMHDYCERVRAAAERSDVAAVRELFLAGAPNSKISLALSNQTDDSLYFKTARGSLNKFIKETNEKYLGADPAATSETMRKTALICRAAASVIDRFRDNYTSVKRRRGVVSFADLSMIATELILNPDGSLTPYGEVVADRYTHVFIDEYQDTNDIQDRLFAAVSSKCGRFLVGDIKQSIYGFRGAEPSVFAAYREKWQNGDGGRAIFMSDNFRSASPVIDFTNAVSRYMFRFGRIPFSDDDLLRCGRGEDAEPCEVCIVPYTAEKGKSTDRVAIEAEYVADRICDMVKGGTRPEDIAILMRKTAGGSGEKFAAALTRRGIPVMGDGKAELLERPDILYLICLLRAADNPLRDTYLAGAMCSTAFGFTLGSIAVLRKLFPAEYLWFSVKAACESDDAEHTALISKCRAFREFEEQISTAAATLDCAAIIDRLRSMPNIRASLQAEAAGSGAVDEFYELARRRGGSLFDFLSFISSPMAKFPANAGGATSGVSILTIHKSKGLEFPICFIVGTNSDNKKTDKSPILVERGYGPSLKLCDSSGLVRCDNVLRRCAVLRKERDSVAEEMRILYVAMTRAREHLIVTCTEKDPPGLLARCRMGSRYTSAYSIAEENNAEMILSALNAFGGSFAKISVAGERAAAEDGAATAPHKEIDTAEAERIADVLRDRLAFRYPAEFLRDIPSKLTVSRLYPEILDEYDTSAVLPECDGEQEVPEVSVPAFIRGTAYSPADSGSAAHLIMQFCDFEGLRDRGVGAELCRLRDAGFLSEAEAEAANLDYIEKFRRSAFFERILGAREMRREFRFNALIPADTLTGDPERARLLRDAGTSVTAQGVIDIVFTDADGRLVLADYKTDRLTEFELCHRDAAAKKLWGRHRRQLGYYALVCEGMFGRRPDEVLIYSMPLGDTLADIK